MPDFRDIQNEPGVQDATVNDFLLPFLLAGGGKLLTKAPTMAEGAAGLLKGLGNEGKAGLGAAVEASPEVGAVNKGLEALTTPAEMAEVQSVLKNPAKTALDLMEKDSGATLNVAKGSLANTPHYAVSVFPERELIIKGEPTLEEIQAYMTKNKDLLNDPANSFGLWKDKGQTYLDVVVTTPDKEAAMKMGLENNQKAIFDLKKMEEVRLDQGESNVK
jgi:hypothetical protein